MINREKYALISVYDKTGIVEFAKTLISLGYTIISTGGTAKTLLNSGIKIVPIHEITGNPECFNGRMKTISFQIESGILFDRDNPKHQKEARQLGIKPIDIVVCNFYPFEKEQKIDNIDIGGPTMVRAAAKNNKNVLVVTDPNDYNRVVNSLHEKTELKNLRLELAAKAFYLTSFYDSLVGRYLTGEEFPEMFTLPGRKLMNLRYGENPHQKSAVYVQPVIKTPFSTLIQLAGRGLSLTNITDINAGLEAVSLFNEPAAVVIKHNTPCGIALGNTVSHALVRAIEADPESAFGGVIVLNKPLDLNSTRVIINFKKVKQSNIDIVTAPKILPEAQKLLTGLRKSMGIYSFDKIPKKNISHLNLKWIRGGFALQVSDDNIEEGFRDWKIVTNKKPTTQQISQMRIGWKFITRIRSNSVIVVDKNLPMTRGIGTGQTSRVRSTKIALEQAGKYAKGGILVSDSFFPFDDSVILARKYGISAIVQQGGSINDQKVIGTANKYGIAMVFTSRRAFWH